MKELEVKKEIKKINITKILKITLVIIWMLVVFYFSHQIGDDSSNMSGNTLRRIITFFNSEISHEKLEMLVELFQPVIRKLAHYTMYTLGGFLIYNAVYCAKNSFKTNLNYSVIIGVGYAITDEIHQLFIPGRTGKITDVLIDSLGVLSGIFIYIIIKKWISYVKIKRKAE